MNIIIFNQITDVEDQKRVNQQLEEEQQLKEEEEEDDEDNEVIDKIARQLMHSGSLNRSPPQPLASENQLW